MSKAIILLIACCLLAWGLAGGEDTLEMKIKQGDAANELLKPKEMLPAHSGALIFDESSSVFAFERIAKAWREGDAEALAPYLGEGKVTIQLPKVVGGVLSKSQAEYVLRDLFKYTVTEKFEFTKYDEFVSEGVVGIADRTYRSGKEGLAMKDKVSVWLVKEGGEKPRWVIKEIRAK
jgi:Domain of unknown function (DUF4783)